MEGEKGNEKGLMLRGRKRRGEHGEKMRGERGIREKGEVRQRGEREEGKR